MTVRKDGLETRERLLEVALRIFSEKGYQGTTISHICRAARTNVAAVNYHFRSKEGLYAEVWRRAFNKSLTIYPPDGGLPASAPAQERLRVLVASHVHRVLDRGALGHAGQILLMEMANPTEAIQGVLFQAVEPLMQRTFGIIRELLGPGAADRQVALCAMSIVHQCFAYSHRRCKHPAGLQLAEVEDIADAVADHITVFSLAGIAAVRAQSQQQLAGRPAHGDGTRNPRESRE